MTNTLLAQAGETIAIASDHAGVDLKAAVKHDLAGLGYKVLDLGPMSTDSVDYPDFGHALADSISSGKAKAGVAICGSGIGISIAVNRHNGLRAALVHDTTGAELARQHNNANVVALGARFTAPDAARDIVKTFFSTPFEGGRHTRRVEKLG